MYISKYNNYNTVNPIVQNNYDFAFKQGFSVGLKPQLLFFKLAFDFCQFCMVICIFISTTTANDIDFEGFLSQILSITMLKPPYMRVFKGR